MEPTSGLEPLTCRFINGEQPKIMHYMAKHTGGEYFSVPPSEYEKKLQTILIQLHFRYELGFIPPAINGKRQNPPRRADPNGLKTHPPSEQPQPRKRGWSIHTSSRGMRRII